MALNLNLGLVGATPIFLNEPRVRNVGGDGEPVNKNNIKEYMQKVKKSGDMNLWRALKQYGKTNGWIQSSVKKGMIVIGAIFAEWIRRLLENKS